MASNFLRQLSSGGCLAARAKSTRDDCGLNSLDGRTRRGEESAVVPRQDVHAK
jgi:hypothetical protein